MTRIDAEHELRIGCQGRCDECDCQDPDQSPQGQAAELHVDGNDEEVDILTRGLLGSFARFIATGEEGSEGSMDETSVSIRPPAGDHQEYQDEGRPHDEALYQALGRVEAAMGALVSAMPNLQERLADMESRVENWSGSEVASGVDRDGVATSLRDRLAGVERECNRLASVPIERMEARVEAAERSLGSLVERAEAAVNECASQRESAERAIERLTVLASALSPWVELLELRESEDGLPKPMSALLRVAGAELAREMSGVRGSLERFAGVLELPEIEPSPMEGGAPQDVQGLPGEGAIVAPEEPSEERPRKKPGKKAVRAKGSEAEAPRRGASEKRLSAEAKLRARSRAEGRPPRR
jgi:hypothetical protein